MNMIIIKCIIDQIFLMKYPSHQIIIRNNLYLMFYIIIILYLILYSKI